MMDIVPIVEMVGFALMWIVKVDADTNAGVVVIYGFHIRVLIEVIQRSVF